MFYFVKVKRLLSVTFARLKLRDVRGSRSAALWTRRAVDPRSKRGGIGRTWFRLRFLG